MHNFENYDLETCMTSGTKHLNEKIYLLQMVRKNCKFFKEFIFQKKFIKFNTTVTP